MPEEVRPPRYRYSLRLVMIAALEKHPKAMAVPTNPVTRMLGSKSMGSSIRGPTEAPSRRAHIALYVVSELTHILDDGNRILNTPVIIDF